MEDHKLTRLFTCFSRDYDEIPVTSNSRVKYVQDNIWLHRKQIIDLIHKMAILYVCGDAKGMAVEVYGTLINIFQQELCKFLLLRPLYSLMITLI